MLLHARSGALCHSGSHGRTAAVAPVACVRAHPSQPSVAAQQRRLGSRPTRLVQCRFYGHAEASMYGIPDTCVADAAWEEQQEDDAEDGAPLEVHHVHSRLPLHSVALGDTFRHVVLYEDGEAAWSSVLPEGLYTELSKTVKRGKDVAAVAMGRNQGSDSYSRPANPDEVWFMMRSTGTTYMGGGCELELRHCWWNWEGQDRVVNVACAPNGGWYTYTQGGGAKWLNLPSSLTQDLDENWHKEGGVKCLSVGHNGEWFVLYNSGRYYWLGVHPTLHRLLSKKQVGNRDIAIEWVELGPDGTFVALFDTHTVWYGDEVLTDHLLDALS